MKITKSEIKNAFLGGIVGIILTTIWDYLEKVPIFSTFLLLFKWIWNNILTANIPVWIIIIVLITWNFLRLLFKNFSKTDTNNFIFFQYTEDEFENNKWRWSWKKHYNGKYVVDNLSILCSNCETPMNFDSYYSTATCPRCNKIIRNFKKLNDVEAVIIDNLNRKQK